MKLETLLEAPKVFERFEVYRLGKNPKHLAGKNAGDIPGLAAFMGLRTSEIYHPNKLITKYEVVSLSRYWEEYEQLKGQFQIGSSKHTPDPDGEPIGRVGTLKGGFWYSFPQNGAWDYKVIKSVKASKVNDLFMEISEELSMEELTSMSPMIQTYLVAAIEKVVG